MALNFQRVATVTVGPSGGDGVEVSGQRITFKVAKSDDDKANSLDVQIYNCAPDTRKLFETTDNSLTLNAGYVDNVKTLAIGDISRGTTRLQGADRVTDVSAGDGLRTLGQSRTSRSYDGAVSARQMIEDIARDMNLEIRDTLADLTGKFNAGWAFVGPSRTALTDIARRFGLSWSIQNDQLQITEYRGPNTIEAVLITPETGMIGSPETLDADREDMKTAKEPPGLRVVTLLNPLYEPGGIVMIDSRDYNRAEYRIKRVEHTGDTHGGAWQSVLEVVER